MARRLTSLALLLTLGLCSPALAQERPEAPGLRVGSFVLVPRLSVTAGHDSNLFLAPAQPDGSIVVRVVPELAIRSDWNRHALKLEARAEGGYFATSSADRYLDADLELSGEIGITRLARIQASVAIARGHDPRGADDTPGTSEEPVIFTTLDLGLSADFRFSYMRITPFAQVRRLDFSDVALTGGGRANQDDRDRIEGEVGLETGLGIGRGYEVFLRTSLLATDYRAALDDTGISRDSTGWRALGGLRLRLSRLIEGSAAVGYVYRDHDDPALSDTSALAADVGLTWAPTRRLEFSLALSRDLGETTVPGAANRRSGTGELSARYGLTRTLDLRLGGGAGHLEFEGAGRTDRLFEAGVSADWEATRRLTISPEYRFARRLSDAPGLGYARHGFFLTASWGF